MTRPHLVAPQIAAEHSDVLEVWLHPETLAIAYKPRTDDDAEAVEEIADAMPFAVEVWASDAQAPEGFEKIDTVSSLSEEEKSYKPPAAVAAAARKGLELRKKQSPSNKGGLDQKQASKEGIGSGVTRAAQLANRQSLSLTTVKRMKSFFARHSAYKHKHKSEPEGPARVSWLLWGGDAGERWANSIVNESLEENAKVAFPPNLINVMKPAMRAASPGYGQLWWLPSTKTATLVLGDADDEGKAKETMLKVKGVEDAVVQAETQPKSPGRYLVAKLTPRGPQISVVKVTGSAPKKPTKKEEPQEESYPDLSEMTTSSTVGGHHASQLGSCPTCGHALPASGRCGVCDGAKRTDEAMRLEWVLSETDQTYTEWLEDRYGIVEGGSIEINVQDVQDYFDFCVAQDMNHNDAKRKTKAKFKLKHLEVNPMGRVASDDVPDVKAGDPNDPAPPAPAGGGDGDDEEDDDKDQDQEKPEPPKEKQPPPKETPGDDDGD